MATAGSGEACRNVSRRAEVPTGKASRKRSAGELPVAVLPSVSAWAGLDGVVNDFDYIAREYRAWLQDAAVETG